MLIKYAEWMVDLLHPLVLPPTPLQKKFSAEHLVKFEHCQTQRLILHPGHKALDIH